MTGSGQNDKVALVVGGRPEVFSAVSQALTRQGFAVAFAQPAGHRSGPSAGPETAASTIPVDLTDSESAEQMARAVVDEFGRIDVLVNGDNYYPDAQRSAWNQIDPDEWDRCFAMIVRANWLSCRAVAPYLKAQRSGRIVTIGCSAAMSGQAGFLHYVTATSALIGVTRSLAREVGDYGVSVNMVCPDPDAKLERELRAGSSAPSVEPSPAPALAAPDGTPAAGPEAVAGSVMFFVGPDSGFITGQTYLVNGGSWVQ